MNIQVKFFFFVLNEFVGFCEYFEIFSEFSYDFMNTILGQELELQTRNC